MADLWMVMDTTSMDLRVALVRGDELVAIADPDSIPGRDLSIKLLPMMDNLLKSSGATLGHVSRILTCLGPGSFTGTRIGLATCRAVAGNSSVQLAGYTLFHAQAFQAAAGQALCHDGSPAQAISSEDGQEIICLSHARADLYYRAVMRFQAGFPQVAGEPELISESDIDPAGQPVIASWTRDFRPFAQRPEIKVMRYSHAALPAVELVRAVRQGQCMLPGEATGDWIMDIMPLYMQEPFAIAKSRVLPGLS